MNDEHLRRLLARAMGARRRHEWAQARERLKELRAVADAGRAPAWSLGAEAHLALLNGDREAAEGALTRLAVVQPASPAVAALGMLMAGQWPAEPRDCQTHLVARAATFRRLCRDLPREGEVGLELGASQGFATRGLARRCRLVYAVEKSAKMASRTREATADLPNVRVVEADAGEPGIVRAHVPHADGIFLDIGGSSPVRLVLQAAFIYGELYRPRVMVIRSVALGEFVSGLASFERL